MSRLFRALACPLLSPLPVLRERVRVRVFFAQSEKNPHPCPSPRDLRERLEYRERE
jgi:hypothetical protein